MMRLLTPISVVTGAVLIGFIALSFGVDKPSAKAATEPEADPQAVEMAIFAGGCFWCVEADFEKLGGVIEATSGYTGGDLENPTYKQVTYEKTGHVEAVKVRYDPSVITYRQLTDYFFRHVDPLDDGGQFCDRGHSYKTGIFVASGEQLAAAQASKSEAEKILGKKVVTPITEAGKFWPAEQYHQDYYKKNPVRYALYRKGCGRDRRVMQVWGDNS